MGAECMDWEMCCRRVMSETGTQRLYCVLHHLNLLDLALIIWLWRLALGWESNKTTHKQDRRAAGMPRSCAACCVQPSRRGSANTATAQSGSFRRRWWALAETSYGREIPVTQSPRCNLAVWKSPSLLTASLTMLHCCCRVALSPSWGIYFWLVGLIEAIISWEGRCASPSPYAYFKWTAFLVCFLHL